MIGSLGETFEKVSPKPLSKTFKRGVIMKNKKLAPLDVILLLCGALTIVNFIVYLIKLIVVPEQPIAYVLTISILAGVILPFVIRNKAKEKFPKIYKVGKTLYSFCLIFYAVTFLFMCSVIFFGKMTETPPEELPENTVFVVYGAKVKGTAENSYPGKSLALRLEKAAELLEKTEGSVCIVAGGMGPDEFRPEGEVMADYLISKGIDEERIFVDAKSKNTIENIENAIDIINEENLEDYTVCCVSTGFHIPRIKLLCGKLGLDAKHYYYAESPNFGTLYPSLVREYMSYGKLILTGHL